MRRSFELLAGAIIATAACVLVFGSGLRAWFVSDAWIFLRRAGLPAESLIQHLVPSNGSYRPADELTFWIARRAFGLDPLPYHLFSLSAHAASSVLVAGIVWQLTRSRVGACAAGVTFLFSIHAHEVVFDVADVHNATGGVLLIGAVLAFVRGQPIISAALTALLFLVDESGLLVLPLAVLYTLICARPLSWPLFRTATPLVVTTIGYLALRYAGGGFLNEVRNPCRTAECLLAGAGQYFNRLFLRPDALISTEAPTLLIALVLFGFAAMLLPQRWRHARVVLFGAAWVAGTGFFFILALWPYIADRFLYIPGAGVAIVVGALVTEALRRTREGYVPATSAAVVVAVLTAWIAVGAVALNTRGVLWTMAGERAAWILEQVVTLHPTPAAGATFSFRGVPHSLSPEIPPGNTGPYIFHNGLDHALAVVYGRDDITVVEELPLQPKALEENIVRLVIYTSGTVVDDPDY